MTLFVHGSRSKSSGVMDLGGSADGSFTRLGSEQLIDCASNATGSFRQYRHQMPDFAINLLRR